MATPQLRALVALPRNLQLVGRAFTTSARKLAAPVPSSSKTAATAPVEEPTPKEINQAPNRLRTWSRSQKPRSEAMTGPRFEQTDYDLQVRAQ